MNRFRVFEIADISEHSPIGVVEVKPGGELEFEPEPGSAHAERFRQALAEIGAAKTLPLTSSEDIGAGADEGRILTLRDVAPSDPLYGWAVADALRRKHGFHHAAVPERGDEASDEPRS